MSAIPYLDPRFNHTEQLDLVLRYDLGERHKHTNLQRHLPVICLLPAVQTSMLSRR